MSVQQPLMHIIKSMDVSKKWRSVMAEKVYKTMKSVGAFSLVTGILLIVGGIAAGVAVIINGAKLLQAKSDLTF